MNMEKYTVIIPTRDRAETLVATLRTCLRQTYENFEIIVSDNCSDDNTKEIVDQLSDHRIKYINPGKRLSMSGNFEFALSHVNEGFVMFIGSDDGIMPYAINYVDSIVKKYKVKAVSCQQANYKWPNFFDNSLAGKIIFGRLRNGNGIEIRNTHDWIQKTLSFKTSYCYDLPNLYCGFVHKDIINKAYKDGVYFKSITPDAYSAFATAIFLESYAFSYTPFVIAGASNKSTGASVLLVSGDNKESNLYNTENDIDICEGFINCPSIEIICTEAFCKLAKNFPEQCSNYHIDFQKMFIDAVSNSNNKTRDEVCKAVNKMKLNIPEFDKYNYSKDNINYIYSFYKLFCDVIKILLNKPQIVEISESHKIGINDVDEAGLVIYAMINYNKSKLFVTKKDLLFRRIKGKK